MDLTVKGDGGMVVMSGEAYEELLDKVQELEATKEALEVARAERRAINEEMWEKDKQLRETQKRLVEAEKRHG